MKMQNRFGSFLRRRAVFASIAAIAVLVAGCDDPTRAPEFTVTFNLNGGGGTLPLPQTVNAGSSITLPGGTGLSRSGFVFGGWNTAADGTGTNHDAGSVFTPTENVTLFARWNTTVRITVTFNSNGGTGQVGALSTYQGSSITLPGQGTLTRAGHTFGGWNTNAAGSGESFNANATFTPAGNTTLFARWIVNFTVTFDPNGGMGTVPAQTTPQGSSITLPSGAGLSRGTYTFGGWNRNAAGAGENFGAGSTFTPTGDVTLFARWIAAGAESFTVTFSANGGGGTAPAPQTVAAGSSIALPSGDGLSQTGFTFGGWNTSATGTGTNHSVGASFTPTGNVTLFARWNLIVNFTVTFSANGGSGTVPATQTVAEGSSITLPSGDGLSRSGFTFGGWNTNAAGTGTNHSAGASFTPTGNVTLFARWIPVGVNFTVTFNANGGGGVVPAPQTMASGSSIMLPSGGGLSKSGFTFGGWNTNATGTGTNHSVGASFTPTGNVTLFARWIPVGVNFTVTFNANGGGGTAPAPQTVAEGSSIMLPSGDGLSRSGFTFGGWNTNIAGTGINHNVGASFTPTNNVTLFARWHAVAVQSFTVTFNANGGEGTVPVPQTVVEGSSITLYSGDGLSRSGFIFDGWNTNAAGTGTSHSADSSFTPTSDITLYARWLVAFTVTFNANGGSGLPPAPQTVAEGSGIILPGSSELSRSGFTFGGWSTDVNGTGTNHSVGTIFTPIGNVILFATWTVTVTFSTNGGTGIPPLLQTVPENSGITLPCNNSFFKNGFIFGGWNTNAAGTGTNYNAGDTFMPIGNITLYARWDFSGIVPGATLSAQLTWIRNNAQSGHEYIVEINRNTVLSSTTLSMPMGTNDVIIILRGVGGMHSISLSSNGRLFRIGSNVTLILDENITLQGRSSNSGGPVVEIISGGTLVMNAGARITGNTNSSTSAGNQAGGGVRVGDGGTFIMSGGEITGNRNTTSTFGGGGGVRVGTGGTFFMYGGIISGNDAVRGGGVSNNGGTFRITGGTIYGNEATVAANLRNTANSNINGPALHNTTASNTISQFGIFADGTFIELGDLSTTNNTIRVVNGVLQ